MNILLAFRISCTYFNTAPYFRKRSNINECLFDKTTAISHEDYVAAKNGTLNISLAGIGTVPKEWFPPLKGANVLALACGGGQQCPVFAAHGAKVTVTDISSSQLAKEKYVSQREGYTIHIVRTDMSKPFPFADNSFDMIFNPISNGFVCGGAGSKKIVGRKNLGGP